MPTCDSALPHTWMKAPFELETDFSEVGLLLGSDWLGVKNNQMFTGRTGPTKVYHQAKPGEKISYLDVTSLYPFINSIARYPVGNPTVHVLNEDVHWTKPEDLPYQIALLKVFVVPPKNLSIPVLPMKLDQDNRLFFFKK